MFRPLNHWTVCACLWASLALGLGTLTPAHLAAQVADPATTTQPSEQPPRNAASPEPKLDKPETQPAPEVTLADLTQTQRKDIENALARTKLLKENVDQLERLVDRNETNDSELAQARAGITTAIAEANEISGDLAPRIDELKTQIEALQPQPAAEGEEAVPISDQLRETMARLTFALSEFTGAEQTASQEAVRATQLLTKVRGLRQTIFAGQILKQSPSPLSRKTWNQLDLDLSTAAMQVKGLVNTWISKAQEQIPSLIALFLFGCALYAGLRITIRQIMDARIPSDRDPRPDFFEKAANAGWVAPSYALPATAAAAAVFFGLNQLGLLENEIREITITAVIPALAIVITTYALARAILQPNRPAWRMLNLDGPPAARITMLLTAIAAVTGLNTILQEVVRSLYLPTSLIVIETAIASIAIGILLVLLVRTRLTPQHQHAGLLEADAEESEVQVAQAKTVSRWHPRFIKIPLLLLAGAIVILSLTGYIGLGRFLAAQVVVTGSAVSLLLLLHLAIRALLGGPGTGRQHAGLVLEERIGLSPAQSEGLVQAAAIMLNAGLAFLALPLILVTWGVPFDAAISWLEALVLGFEVGGVKVSLARILIAVALFAALLIATQLIQKWLDRTVLRPERMDQSIAHSIRTGIGYVGFIAAILVAISYGGLDITNLALVAGALSVGVGFGLQSIVNNFVSGLILLIERPIKVGDWIQVDGHEGHVRRIAVRSTELETFDRSNVIVPNSALITATVQNLTHRNTLGRVIVNVGVSYDSDPYAVRDILQKAAEDCPALLGHPKPYVWFEEFGASSLDFSVRGFVPNVNNRGTARSELRLAIFKALQDNNIEIPYSQHDIRFRDLDGVRETVAKFVRDRQARMAQAPPKSEPKPETPSQPQTPSGSTPRDQPE